LHVVESVKFHWGLMSFSAKEYREYADECMGWAKSAKTAKERDIFLQMAKAWRDAALIARDRRAPSPATSDLAPRPQDKDDNATT
jgi:hypothetical protein